MKDMVHKLIQNGITAVITSFRQLLRQPLRETLMTNVGLFIWMAISFVVPLNAVAQTPGRILVASGIQIDSLNAGPQTVLNSTIDGSTYELEISGITAFICCPDLSVFQGNVRDYAFLANGFGRFGQKQIAVAWRQRPPSGTFQAGAPQACYFDADGFSIPITPIPDPVEPTPDHRYRIQITDTGPSDNGILACVADNLYSDNAGSWNVDVYILPLSVAIDIKPGEDPNLINPKSPGNIPVAILSTSSFDAPTKVRLSSLTFGHTGGEPSLIRCNSEDVNRDGRLDLICQFDTQTAAFQTGDTKGILKGTTVGGTPLRGEDSVRILP